MIFDIKLASSDPGDSNVATHYPVLAPLPIKPCKLAVEGKLNMQSFSQCNIIMIYVHS